MTSTNEYTTVVSDVVRQRNDLFRDPRGSQLLYKELDSIKEGFTRTRQIPFVKPVAGRFLRTEGATGTTTSTLAGAANRLEIYPWIAPADLDVDQIGCNVTTAVASSNIKFVVYSSDNDGRPDALLLQSDLISTATTGAKTAPFVYTLLKGIQYWIGVHHSSTATLSGFQPYTVTGLDNGTIETAKRSKLQRTVTFASNAPDPWVYDANEAATGNPVSIWFRIA